MADFAENLDGMDVYTDFNLVNVSHINLSENPEMSTGIRNIFFSVYAKNKPNPLQFQHVENSIPKFIIDSR